MTTHSAHSVAAAAAPPRAAKPQTRSLQPTAPPPERTQQRAPSAAHVAHAPVADPSPQQQQPAAPMTRAAFLASLHAQQQHTHWRAHSEYHFLVRKQMIARLQRLHPLLATNTTMRYAGQLTRIPELVQRLELMLYKAAASLDEYANVCTLERRVHSLVTLLEQLPPPRGLPAVSTSSSSSSAAASSFRGRRKRTTSGSALPAHATPVPSKRRRRSTSTSTVSSSSSSLLLLPRRTAASPLLAQLNADLLGAVFAFVEGVDTLRHVALVNKFFFVEAPRLVASLCIDVGDAAHARALHGRVARVLPACVNLRALTVTNSRNLGRKNGFTRAFQASAHGHGDGDAAMPIIGTPASFAAAADPFLFTGRVLLHELSELLRCPAHHELLFPKLTHVALLAPFDCANEAEATLLFLRALAGHLSASSSSSPPSSRLESLVLDTTVLGDRRMPRLVALFHEFPAVFQRGLRALELSNNFMGEAGVAALCASLARAWPRLEALSVRRNILTDGDAQRLALTYAAPAAPLPRFATLDVSENFIGKPGFEALAKGLARRRVAITTSLNCMESSEAAHLFT